MGERMKYLDEYRDERIAHRLVAELARRTTQPWVLMEICGGQTHTLMRYGIDEILPAGIELVHGPGCPVCVTSLETIDKAIQIASRPDVTFISYGDMLRVPGSHTDLFHVKAQGGDVRVVYSPTEALKFARANPAARWSFLRSALKPRRPPMPWPSGKRNSRASGIFRYLPRTSLYLQPFERSSVQSATACKASLVRGTSARSWATGNTRTSSGSFKSRLLSEGSSLSTSLKQSSC